MAIFKHANFLYQFDSTNYMYWNFDTGMASAKYSIDDGNWQGTPYPIDCALNWDERQIFFLRECSL